MDLQRNKILIVDDEEKIRDLYIRALIEAGFVVRVASNARQATGMLVREDFDLILLDINMPEVDGKIMFEVIQEFDHKIKIIIVSAYEEYEQKEMVPQAEHYFDKSQGIFALLEKVNEVLGLKNEEDPGMVVRYSNSVQQDT